MFRTAAENEKLNSAYKTKNLPENSEASKANNLQESIEEKFAEANTHFNQGKFAEAVVCYNKIWWGQTIARNDSISTAARHNSDCAYLAKQAETCYLEGRLDEAIVRNTQVLQKMPYNPYPAWKLPPNSAAIHFALGRAYYEQRKITEALSHYNQAIELNPTHAIAYHNRGASYYRQGMFTEAIADYTHAISLLPSALSYSNRAVTYSKNGKLAEAISDFIKALELDPNDNRYSEHLEKTLLRVKKSDLDTIGEKQISSALKLLPIQKQTIIDSHLKSLNKTKQPSFASQTAENAYNLHEQALLYIAQNKFSEAISDLTQAVKLDPKFSLAYNTRGACFYNMGKFDKAIKDYTSAIALDSKCVDAYANRGIAYVQAKKNDKALVDFNHAIKLDPNDLENYCNRGIANYGLGNVKEAIADYDQVFAKFPNHEVARHHYQIAQATFQNVEYGDYWMVVGEYDKAIAEYTNALSLKPNYKVASDKLAAAYKLKNYYESFEKIFAEANTFYNQGKFAEASVCYHKIWLPTKDLIKSISSAALRNREHTDLAQQAAAFQKEGKLDEAIKYYIKALEQKPFNPNPNWKLQTNSEVVHYKLGCAYHDQGKFTEALSHYSQAIELHPSPDSYFNRAKIYTKQGKLAEAISDFTKALELKPNHTQYYEELEKTLLKLKKSDLDIIGENQIFSALKQVPYQNPIVNKHLKNLKEPKLPSLATHHAAVFYQSTKEAEEAQEVQSNRPLINKVCAGHIFKL